MKPFLRALWVSAVVCAPAFSAQANDGFVSMICADHQAQTVNHSPESAELSSEEKRTHSAKYYADHRLVISTQPKADDMFGMAAAYELRCEDTRVALRCADAASGKMFRMDADGTFIYLTGEAGHQGYGLGWYSLHTGVCEEDRRD